MVSRVYYTDEVTQALYDLSKGAEKPLLFLLHGINTDSSNFSKPAEFEVFLSGLHILMWLFHMSNLEDIYLRGTCC